MVGTKVGSKFGEVRLEGEVRSRFSSWGQKVLVQILPQGDGQTHFTVTAGQQVLTESFLCVR